MLFTDRKYGRFNQEELEADVFAMCLLMPKETVFKVWNKYRTITDVSRHFNVPIDAAAFRLNMLGIID